VTQHQALREQITRNQDLPAAAKVSMLASWRTGFNKTVAAVAACCRKTNEWPWRWGLLISWRVCEGTVPQHLRAFLVILEPLERIL
jgi:hypothetical protein